MPLLASPAAPRAPYTWRLADWSTIAAVLTSLGVGGVVGSLAAGRHETAEKFRDRTIEGCRDWLKAHDAVRRELALAQGSLLGPSAQSDESRAAAKASLSKSLAAWRELQTQTFLVALLLAGGTNAPAAQAAQALTVCYERWRDALVEVRAGSLEPTAARKVIHFYVEHARVMYNEFVIEVNEAIRPWAPWRRARMVDSSSFDAIDDLDLFAERIRRAPDSLDDRRLRE